MKQQRQQIDSARGGCSTQTGAAQLDYSNSEANEVLAGQGEPPSQREVYLRKAQAVVDESNAAASVGADPMWLAMNGDNAGVESDTGSQPAEWRRGVKCGDGEFSLANGGTRGGLKDFGDFQKQIMADLNFNHVFDQYSSVETFASACVARYGTSEARSAEVRAIAENLWSYAKQGCDLTGTTDVSELQGLLYALDPLIAEASRSNTRHDGDMTIPGTDTVLQNTDGDEWYGRATMLECRLLSSVLRTELVPEEIITTTIEDTPEVITELTPVPDDDVFDKSTYIVDVSSSMFDDFDVLRDYMDEIDSGDTRMAGMLGQAQPLSWHAGGAEISQEEGRALMAELDELKLQRGSGRRTDAAGVSSMFVRPDSKKVDASEVADAAGGAHDESSLKKVLELLEEIQASGESAGLNGQQIVVATDEGDSSPELLKRVWTLGRQLGVLVKVLYLDDDRVTEIPITSLPEDYIDAIYEDSQTEGYERGRFTTHENNKNASTDGEGTHRRLKWDWVESDWQEQHAAHGGEAFQTYEKVGDRTSRR